MHVHPGRLRTISAMLMIALYLPGCGNGGTTVDPTPSLTIIKAPALFELYPGQAGLYQAIIDRHGYEGEIDFAVDGLPNGVTKETSVGSNGNVSILLRADSTAQVGSHQITLYATGEGARQVKSWVPLKVYRRGSVQIVSLDHPGFPAPILPITAGGSVSLRVRFTKVGYTGPLDFSISSNAVITGSMEPPDENGVSLVTFEYTGQPGPLSTASVRATIPDQAPSQVYALVVSFVRCDNGGC